MSAIRTGTQCVPLSNGPAVTQLVAPATTCSVGCQTDAPPSAAPFSGSCVAPALEVNTGTCCEECCEVFIHESSAYKHWKDHHMAKTSGGLEKPSRCLYCLFARHVRSFLQEHQKKQAEKQPCICPFCSPCCPEKSCSAVHGGQSIQRPQICSYCKKLFPSQDDVDAHEKAHTEKKPYECCACHKHFFHVYHLSSHRKTHLVEKLLHCRFCPRLFKRRTTWNKHEKEHLKKERPHLCEVCQKRFSRKRDLVLHMRVHTGEKPYKCDVCDRCFAQRSAFTSHLRTHTGEKRYVCRFCSRGYSRRTSLELHERRDHASDVAGRSRRQRYSCSSCLLRFTRKGELDFHERTQHTKESKSTGKESFSTGEDVDMQEGTHTGEESYACRFCPESYAQKNDLDEHERAHTNVAKHFCSLCSSSFSTHRGLLAHKRAAHRGTPQKPYTCRFCPQAYDRPSRLKKHERRHEDSEPTTEPEKHVCTVCDKSFSSKQDLVNHKKLQCGEKPYKCSICLKRFVEEHQLSSHVMSHSTVKSYSCVTCQETFTQMSDLSTHIEQHSGPSKDGCSCNTCGELFPSKGSLADHEKSVHASAEVDTYACIVCRKAFDKVSGLASHYCPQLSSRIFAATAQASSGNLL